jgi:hypothetical protein
MQIIDPSDTPPEQWRPGVETSMRVSAVNGATQLCIFEQWISPGNGAPTHSHPVEEVLTVLAGEAEMWLDDFRAIVSGPVAARPRAPQPRFSQFRHGDAAHPRGAGVRGVRGDAGGCDGNGEKVGHPTVTAILRGRAKRGVSKNRRERSFILRGPPQAWRSP